MSFDWSEEREGIWRGTRRDGGDGTVRAVVGGMHGDEQIGAQVVEELSEPSHPVWDEVNAKTVILAVGNPRALSLHRRHTPDGVDLNRLFGGQDAPSDHYEQQRSAFLREHLAEASLLMDIHQTHCPTPPLAVVPHTDQHLALVAALGLSVAVVGTGEIYGETMLSDWLTRRGGLGVTIESGQADTPEALLAAREAAGRFLTLDAKTPVSGKVSVYEVEEVVPAPGNGLRYHRVLGNTDAIAAGEVLGVYEKGEFSAPRDATIFLPREGVPTGAACLILARELEEVSPGENPLGSLTIKEGNR
jgi:predicted deacylase